MRLVSSVGLMDIGLLEACSHAVRSLATRELLEELVD